MLKASTPSQKVLAIALGLSEGRISHMVHGEEDGAVARFYRTVRLLTRAQKAEAGHVIAGALAAAVDEAVQLPEREIRKRLFHALENETEAQAAEDRASMRLYRALASCEGDDASPEDLEELSLALNAHETATQHETAWQITSLVYNRALRVLRGERVAP
jgi:hypothetical protein